MHGPATVAEPNFMSFYERVFLDEHQHPGNRALHVLGVLAGLATLVCAVGPGPWWLVLLFPPIHAAPGLLGHRLFERQAGVGDLRVTRTDYPLWWFIAANHLLALSLLRRTWSAARSPAGPSDTGRC